MKKTLVAVAAMAAVTGAMAEVSITGFLDQAVQTTTTTSSAGAKTTINKGGPNLIGQDQITFGVTEDLGDGMTAYANLVFLAFSATNGGNLTQDTGSGIGLKGAFGNVFVGNVRNQVWQAQAAVDPAGWGTGGFADGSVWTNTNGSAAKSNSLVYTLPSIAQGLNVTVENSYGGTSGTSSDTIGDSTGLGINYTTGGLTAVYAASYTKAISGITTFNIYDGAGLSSTLSSVYDGSIATTQVFGATYDLGVAKLHYGKLVQGVNDGGVVAEDKYTYGVSVPFGALTLAWGHSNAVFTDSGSTQTTVSGDKIYAKYALSKRTNAYITTGKSTTSGSTAALTNSSIGLTHSF